MKQFVHGRELSREFYKQIIAPILSQKCKNLKYTACLLGYGSDVLGYDDVVSTDHMWGPRLYLFVPQKHLIHKDYILDILSKLLPHKFMGYSVNFSRPNPNDNGIRQMEEITEGTVSPLIFINSIDSYLKSYLGTSDFDNLTDLDWLSFSEHKLLSLTKADIYEDQLGLKEILSKISFYPDSVKKYLLASNWSLIAEEQAFVKRNMMLKEKTGSLIIASRIVERLMRLCFLYNNTYAPYSKWFSKAFNSLAVPDDLKKQLELSLTAKSYDERENAMINALAYVAEIHNDSTITDGIEPMVTNYFERDIKVIFANRYASAIKETYRNNFLYNSPLIGSMSEVSNFTNLFDNALYREQIKTLYYPIINN